MSLTLENLPNKFLPSLLGHESCPATFKNEIDEIFARSIENAPSIKSDYVWDAGKWVIKGDRTGAEAEAMRPDTNIYRVRKAEKIRNFIQENHLEEHVMVPRKYIYWDERSGKFYVIAEKADLSDEVATPQANARDLLKLEGEIHGGQMEALTNNARERTLTPEQAEALAKLSFKGYTDLTYNNMFFTTDGRVAILDTEPIKRTIKKMFSESYYLTFLFQDTASLITQQAIAGTAKLKLSCSDPLALRAVEKVEKEHFLWNLAQLVGKIAVCVLVISAAALLLPHLAIPALAITALKVCFISLASIKLITLTFNIMNASFLWYFSHVGMDQNGQGMAGVTGMELAGAC